MFRSLSRITVVLVFVLALVLSTAPAQALPGDAGTQFETLDASWFDFALSWFDGLLGGSDHEPRSMTTALSLSSGGGTVGTMSGSCIDPMGNPCGDIPYP